MQSGGSIAASRHLRSGWYVTGFRRSPCASRGMKRWSSLAMMSASRRREARSAKAATNSSPYFLSEAEQADHGKALENWREKRFKEKYLPLVRPFSAVPDLLKRVRSAGLKVAVATSAKKDQLDQYLEIAGISSLVDEATASEDVEESEAGAGHLRSCPEKNEFERCRRGRGGRHALRRRSGPQGRHPAHRRAQRRLYRERITARLDVVEVYPGPASIYCCFDTSLLAREAPHDITHRSRLGNHRKSRCLHADDPNVER